MLLELIINNVITDDNTSFTAEQKSHMLGEIAREYMDLWQEMESPVSGQVGITNAVRECHAFNSFQFYATAYYFAERTFKRLVRMKAEPHEHELISYREQYEQELKEMNQARKEWHQNDVIDQTLTEISQQIKGNA